MVSTIKLPAVQKMVRSKSDFLALAPFGVTLKTCPNGFAMVVRTVGRISEALKRAMYLRGKGKILPWREKPRSPATASIIGTW